MPWLVMNSPARSAPRRIISCVPVIDYWQPLLRDTRREACINALSLHRPRLLRFVDDYARNSFNASLIVRPRNKAQARFRGTRERRMHALEFRRAEPFMALA